MDETEGVVALVMYPTLGESLSFQKKKLVVSNDMTPGSVCACVRVSADMEVKREATDTGSSSNIFRFRSHVRAYVRMCQ